MRLLLTHSVVQATPPPLSTRHCNGHQNTLRTCEGKIVIFENKFPIYHSCRSEKNTSKRIVYLWIYCNNKSSKLMYFCSDILRSTGRSGYPGGSTQSRRTLLQAIWRDQVRSAGFGYNYLQPSWAKMTSNCSYIICFTCNYRLTFTIMFI